MYSISKFGAQTFSALCISTGLALIPAVSEAFSIAVVAPPSNPVVHAIDKAQLDNLKNYDVLVFIDASRSMSRPTSYTPGNGSRWEWCQEQTSALRDSLKVPLGSHLKVVAFNDSYKVYPDVDWNSIPGFFQRTKPEGTTDATRAIKTQLNQYFAARKAAQGKPVRPLLIAMITDGCPDKPATLKETIVEATKQMDDPKEIAITFLQVGSDPKATRYLQELDECLISQKARYDIVTTKTFDQLNQLGLANALLQSVNPEQVASLK